MMPFRYDSAVMVRHQFLKVAGNSSFAVPAITFVRTKSPPTKTKELDMEIKRDQREHKV